MSRKLFIVVFQVFPGVFHEFPCISMSFQVLPSNISNLIPSRSKPKEKNTEYHSLKCEETVLCVILGAETLQVRFWTWQALQV